MAGLVALHPKRNQMKSAAVTAEKNFLAAFLIFIALLTVYISNIYSLFQFHFFAILFQTVISFCVFVFAWNSRTHVENSFLCFLGTAFLFVGLINICQLLTMNAFLALDETIKTHSLSPLRLMSPDDERIANYSTQLWLLARFFECLSFAFSFYFIRRKINFFYYFSIFIVVSVLLILCIFEWHYFPIAFDKIHGFTRFKNGCQLVTATVFLGAIGCLSTQRKHLGKHLFQLLAAALMLSALAEFGFSLNLKYYDASRPVAHLLKCIAFYFIYRAFITTGFSDPIALLFRDLKKSETTLARERDKLFSIFDILPGFIFIQSQDHTISYVNQRFKDVFGELHNRRCHEVFHDCHSPCEYCPAQRVLETSIPRDFEWTHRDGRTFIIHHGYFKDSDGTPKVIASGIDITDRVSARNALEESEERYRTLYEYTPVMLHSIDKTGRIINVSDRWLSALGYEKEAVIGKKFIDFLTPESRQYRLEIALPALLDTGFCEGVYYQMVKKNKGVMDIELSAVAEKDGAGNMVRSLAVSIDVTEKLKAKKELEKARNELEHRVVARTTELNHKTRALEQEIREKNATEEALRASEKKYSSLVKNSLTGIYIKQGGKIIFANDRFCEIHGYPPDEILGIETWRLVHPHDRAKVEAYSQKCQEGTAIPGMYEARSLTKSGKTIWVTRNNTHINYRDKPAILGNLVDITLRKKMGADLEKSENELRLLSARLLNAQENERKRIALELHDTIAQNLVAIKFTLGQKLKQMGGAPPPTGIKIEDIIDVVQENISEVRRIMTDLRPSLLDDLGILATISWHCREFQKIYYHLQIIPQIDLAENDVPEDLKIVIFRILQEAMNNAAKHSHATEIRLYLGRHNNIIKLIIEDNGKGFDYKGTMSRIDARSGLGLVGMRERTEQSFGTFSIQSRKGEGTHIYARWRLGTNGVSISAKAGPTTPGSRKRSG